MAKRIFSGRVIDGQKNYRPLSRSIPFQLIGAILPGRFLSEVLSILCKLDNKLTYFISLS